MLIFILFSVQVRTCFFVKLKKTPCSEIEKVVEIHLFEHRLMFDGSCVLRGVRVLMKDIPGRSIALLCATNSTGVNSTILHVLV